MILRIALLTGFLVLELSATSLACSCLSGGGFLRAIQKSKVIVRGELLEYGPMKTTGVKAYLSATIRIRDMLLGSVDSAVITLLGDNGTLCRVYITPDDFVIGGEYVLGLQRAEGEVGYEISDCGGTFWLPVRNESVCGPIRGEKSETVPYIELRDLVCDALK